MFWRTFKEVVKIIYNDVINKEFIAQIFTDPKKATKETFIKKTQYQWLIFRSEMINTMFTGLLLATIHLLYYGKDFPSVRYRKMFDLSFYDKDATITNYKVLFMACIVYLSTWVRLMKLYSPILIVMHLASLYLVLCYMICSYASAFAI